MQDPNQVQTIRERLLHVPSVQLEPTRLEIEAEAKRKVQCLFDAQLSTGLDLYGRQRLQLEMRDAEDRLRIARGLLPKFRNVDDE